MEASTDDRRLRAAIAELRTLPPLAAIGAETRRLWRAEIAGSIRLAGASLDAAAVDALLDRGIAAGDRPFDDYVLTRAYASASRWVALRPRREPGSPEPLITVEDLRRLNALVRAVPGGGAWRTGTLPVRDGIVSPAAWMVPREIEACIDRAGRGPGDAPPALWLARTLARIVRIAPFGDANGRTARLAMNLLARRLDLPPVVIAPQRAAAYRAALAAAEANAPEALARLIARSLIAGIDRLRAVAGGPGELGPLRLLAGDRYTALAKAAQRGRLQTVRRGGRYYTRPDWIARYDATT
jgi:hypothetical protein